MNYATCTLDELKADVLKHEHCTMIEIPPGRLLQLIDTAKSVKRIQQERDFAMLSRAGWMGTADMLAITLSEWANEEDDVCGEIKAALEAHENMGDEDRRDFKQLTKEPHAD